MRCVRGGSPVDVVEVGELGVGLGDGRVRLDHREGTGSRLRFAVAVAAVAFLVLYERGERGNMRRRETRWLAG